MVNTREWYIWNRSMKIKKVSRGITSWYYGSDKLTKISRYGTHWTIDTNKLRKINTALSNGDNARIVRYLCKKHFRMDKCCPNDYVRIKIRRCWNVKSRKQNSNKRRILEKCKSKQKEIIAPLIEIERDVNRKAR